MNPSPTPHSQDRPPLKVLFLTERAEVHQKSALAAAPPGVEVKILRRPDHATLLPHLSDADVLVSERRGVVDAGLITAAPRLKLIQRLGSMVHDIDLEAARSRGLPVCRHPLPTCIAVAEHSLMQILALLKRLPEVSRIALQAGDWGIPRRSDENTFAFNWSRRENIGCLLGKTVGIVGFGEIGAELARRLQGFSPAAVMYHKRKRLPAAAERALCVNYCDWARLLRHSEILVVLLPYSKETHHLIDIKTLEALPQGALLVHCGSGGVIDEEALVTVLKSGHLCGAALDTYEWEPIQPTHPLLPLGNNPSYNVILTPHTAASTRQLAKQENWDIWENVRRLLSGQSLQERVA